MKNLPSSPFDAFNVSNLADDLDEVLRHHFRRSLTTVSPAPSTSSGSDGKFAQKKVVLVGHSMGAMVMLPTMRPWALP